MHTLAELEEFALGAAFEIERVAHPVEPVVLALAVGQEHPGQLQLVASPGPRAVAAVGQRLLQP